MDLKTIAPDDNNDITMNQIFVDFTNWGFNATVINCDSYDIDGIRYNAGWQLKVKIVRSGYDTFDNWLSAYVNQYDPNATYTKFHYLYGGSTILEVEASRSIIYTSELSFHTGLDSYSDILKAAILTQRTELQLDRERGIPYFETAFYSPSRIEAWANAVRRTTKSFPWVVRILDFVYNFVVEDKVDGEIKNVNELRYTLKVLTDLGVATVRSDEP